MELGCGSKEFNLSFYAKLGCMDVAMKEFESVGLLSQVSWNAMIDGYMKMGNTYEAFNVFQCVPNVDTEFCPDLESCFGSRIHYPSKSKFPRLGPILSV